MRYSPLLASLVAVPLIWAAPTFAQDTQTDAAPTEVTADTVLADVNGVEITLGHMIALRSRLPEQYRQVPEAQLFPALLDQLIDQTLLAQRAEASGDDDARSVQVYVENELRSLLANRVVETIVESAVTDEALSAAYDEAVSGMTQDQQYNASHILVETEEEAQAIAAEIAGGADFSEQAKAKSTGPSGPNGGNLGWFGQGDMVPTFDAVVQTMTVGDVSEPVQTQFGWHVIKLNDTRLSPLPSRQELQPTLRQQIVQSALREELEKMRDGATVTLSETEVPPSALSSVELDDE
ncbi:MAG: peptidylprolyl isomerase [Pseudomonadota bacterium]